jgi:hypothetical protein
LGLIARIGTFFTLGVVSKYGLVSQSATMTFTLLEDLDSVAVSVLSLHFLASIRSDLYRRLSVFFCWLVFRIVTLTAQLIKSAVCCASSRFNRDASNLFFL